MSQRDMREECTLSKSRVQRRFEMSALRQFGNFGSLRAGNCKCSGRDRSALRGTIVVIPTGDWEPALPKSTVYGIQI
jgi:hypothetical protein